MLAGWLACVFVYIVRLDNELWFGAAVENSNATSIAQRERALLSHYGCNYPQFFFIANRNLLTCVCFYTPYKIGVLWMHTVAHIFSPVLDILRANIGFERIFFYSIRISNSVQCYVVKGCLSPLSLYPNKNICSHVHIIAVRNM